MTQCSLLFSRHQKILQKQHGGSMGDILEDISKNWISYLGRKNSAEPYLFPKHEVVSEPFSFHVSYFLQGVYLNLHPTLYAVCIFSGGNRKRFDDGGLIMPFPPGKATLHYIDKTDRQSDLLRVTENTKDAAKVTLAVTVTYRVSDPLKVFEIQQPVETLFSLVQADLKEYIRSRKYEDLIGNDSSQMIDSGLVAKYIKQQYGNRYPMSKVFTIIDVIVQEKEGDPVFIDKLKSFKSQVVDGESKIKMQNLNQKIFSQETEYKSKLDQQKAQADMLIQKMRNNQDMQIQKMRSEQDLELQKLRNELQQAQDAWDQKQKKWARSMDAIVSALKSPYLREVEGVIGAIVNELRGLAGDSTTDAPLTETESIPKNKSDKNKLDTLTDQLFSLLDRSKNNG